MEYSDPVVNEMFDGIKSINDEHISLTGCRKITYVCIIQMILSCPMGIKTPYNV